MESTQLHQIRQHSVSLVQMGNHPVRGKKLFQIKHFGQQSRWETTLFGEKLFKIKHFGKLFRWEYPNLRKKHYSRWGREQPSSEKKSSVGEKTTLENNPKHQFWIEHFGEKSRWGTILLGKMYVRNTWFTVNPKKVTYWLSDNFKSRESNASAKL